MQRTRGRVREPEATGVREYGNVEGLRYLLGHGPPRSPSEVVQQLPSGTGAGIDEPRACGELPIASVMIDAGYRNRCLLDDAAEMAQPADVGAIQDDNEVGILKVLQRL